jgi:hypothetical protein
MREKHREKLIQRMRESGLDGEIHRQTYENRVREEKHRQGGRESKKIHTHTHR